MTLNGNETLLKVENLVKYFPIFQGAIIRRKTGNIHAVDGISFEIKQGETLGLVGESGCGKSTTGRTVLQLYRPTSGNVYLAGQNLVTMKGEELRKMRSKMQMIFQDPYASLNSRMTVGEIIAEPMLIHGTANRKEASAKTQELLRLVGLEPEYSNRFPHEFSGGQRQRVGVARALSLQPSLIVCDEPISSLDVSIQAQVVNLLEDLQKQFNLSYLFIAHDLSMVQHISTSVAVMYLGVIVELADQNQLYTSPLHPYTQSLLSAVPIPDPVTEKKRRRHILVGEIPSPANPPSGCRFRTRCPLAAEICTQVRPEFREMTPGHWVACHMAGQSI
ncbi:MAG: oligopeptide/dipeptide ABC transporter ATP-binding protein [Anaerolineales bacterium]|jgi:oligopeptide transport system ATP-binding protein